MPCIDYTKRDDAIALSNYILSNSYLQNISSLPLHNKPCPISPSHLQLLKLSESNQYAPLPSSIFSLLIGLQSLCITFCYIIYVHATRITTYIGVSHPIHSLAGIQLLKDGLATLDPSLLLEIIPQSEVPTLLNDCLINTSLYNAITSATCYPLSKTLSSPFPELIKTLPTDETYTILCLGTPIDFTNYLSLQREILKLSTALYPFREITHACTDSSNDSANNASSHAHHEHETLSCGENSGTSSTNACTDSCGTSQSTPVKVNDKFSMTLGSSSNHSESNTENATTGMTNNKSTQSICIQTVSDSNTEATTKTHLTNHREFNTEVERLILECAALFDFYATNLVPPVFQFATYFLSSSIATSVRAGAYYMTNLTQSIPSTYPQYLNTWTPSCNTFFTVADYLSNFSHPMFNCPCFKNCLTPTLPWPATSLSQII